MALTPVFDYTGRTEGGRTAPAPTPEISGGPERPSFGDLVRDFAGDVNNLQFEAGHAVDMLATGQAADVHQVMIAVQQASVALDLMLEIRNRVLEGYQELIRMQV